MKSSSNPNGYEMILFQGTSTKQKIEKKSQPSVLVTAVSVCMFVWWYLYVFMLVSVD